MVLDALVAVKSHSPTSILTVVVLYNCEPSQSQSFCALLQILNENADLATHFSLVLYDNSPQPQKYAMPASFPIHYVHDPANGGLASAYNFALARAESEQCEWLLLLDQDTSPTREFIVELLEAASTLHAQPDVAAIIPKLMVNGVVHSPAIPFIEQLRRQFRPPKQPIGQDVVGILQQHMCPYNSGSTLRVSAVRSVGGFPQEFWLDYLDHAVFHALLLRGYRVYMMLATLVHDASYGNLDRIPFWRLHNVLMAQSLYVKKRGNLADRLLYRVWLLRYSRNLRQSCNDPRIWRETMLQALLFRVPKGLGPTSPPAPMVSRD
jgi:GT2 family glycosyltransferase